MNNDSTPKIAIVGHGRAGKDTAAEWIAAHTNLRHFGSTSRTMVPLMALVTGQTMEDCYRCRHECRQRWKDFCDDFRKGSNSAIGTALAGAVPNEIEATETVKALREDRDLLARDDPAKIIRLHLQQADVVPGIRGDIELLTAMRQQLLDLVIWVENPRVPTDFTVDFHKEDADCVVMNESTLEVFYARLARILRTLRGVEVCQ
jgi:hypothetical protein